MAEAVFRGFFCCFLPPSLASSHGFVFAFISIFFYNVQTALLLTLSEGYLRVSYKKKKKFLQDYFVNSSRSVIKPNSNLSQTWGSSQIP